MASNLAVAVLNGIVWGLIMALIALGLNLIFGLLHIINMAHGALYMLGAVFSWYVIELTGNYWLALFVAPLGVGLVGLASSRLVNDQVERMARQDVPSLVYIGELRAGLNAVARSVSARLFIAVRVSGCVLPRTRREVASTVSCSARASTFAGSRRSSAAVSA